MNISITVMITFLLLTTMALSDLQEKCSPVITKLGECLPYASGKVDVPSSSCCSTVADIRKDNPVCLCYTIQMAHAGGSGVSSLGLQMGRLIQLPIACKLADTDVTNCPKLLNLSPSSPDYAIFSNTTKASSSTTSSGSSSSKSTSVGAAHHIHFFGVFVIVTVSATLLSFF